jgi:MtrB/PioB family decaheme-associated outer membrane protein
MRQNNALRITALAVLLAPAAALAQVDTSEWKCEYCPFEKGYSADVDAGVNYVSDDVARFGNGTGMDEIGAEVDLGGNGVYVSDGTRMTWYAEDLGLDSRVLDITVGKPGTYEIGLGYRELPYRLFGDTATVFTLSDSQTLTLPATWVTAGTTSGFTELASSLRPQNIEKDRQVIEFGATYLPTSKVRLYADYSRQQRDGVSIMAGSRFTQSAYLPRPVDDYTDRFDAGVRFLAGPVNLALAYYGSFYRNELDSLTWDNPFSMVPGAELGRLALEPDNDFQQFSLSGVYRTDTFNTVIAFSAAMGRGEQNDKLLPYTINSTLVSLAPLPPTLDGQVDTSNYAFTLTSRPHKRASVKLSYRFDERDNQTPVTMWSRVITDTIGSGGPEANVPYSFERARLNVSGTLKVFDTLSVSGGYDRTDLDRDYQEVAQQSEDTGWGKARWRPTAWLEATFKGGASRREVEDYDTDIAVSLGQNPLMRKYNLAYRYREFGELSLSASLPEKPLSVGMTWFYADDSYTESQLGMTESNEDRFTVDFSWAVSDAASIYVTAGTEAIDAIQLGSETFTGPTWEASHDDSFTHYGGGFRLAAMEDKLDLTFDYTRSDGETEILFAGQAVSPVPLPQLDSTMDSLRLSLRYVVSARFDATFGARWERFEANDWALEGVQPDTLPTVLTMGASPYDYDVWVVGVGFRYKIGADTD